MAKNDIPNLGIVTRFVSLNDKFPGRIYIFNSSFDVAYDNSVGDAIRHYRDTLNVLDSAKFLEGFDFFNAIMWGNLKHKMIDFFGYKVGKDWKANPDVFNWVTKNSNISSNDQGCAREVSCGKGFRILGDEERYRLTTNNLSEYLAEPPSTPGLTISLDDFAQPSWGRMLKDRWDR